MSRESSSFANRHERLYQVARAMHSTLEPADALQLVMREVVDLLDATSGSLVLVNPTTGLLDIEASEGLSADGAALKLRLDEGITGWVARTGEPARVDDVSADKRYVTVRAGIQSELSLIHI